LAGANASTIQQSARFGYTNTQTKPINEAAEIVKLGIDLHKLIAQPKPVNVAVESVKLGIDLHKLIAQPNFQEEAKFCHKKMDEMLTDPKTMVKAQHVAEQLEGLMAQPTVQEQVNVFAERVDENFQEQMKLVTQNMEMMQPGDPDFQEQTTHVEEQMKAVLAQSVTKQMEALSTDPSFQEQAKKFADGIAGWGVDEQMQNSEDKMVDKILDRGLKTFSPERADLENAMLRKPSSAAVQSRTGMKSPIAPPSIHVPFTRSAIRSSALKQGKNAIIRASKSPISGIALPFPGNPSGTQLLKKRPVAAPEEEDEFISEETEENIREAAYLFARLAVASVMIHHGQEKILSAEAFTKFAIDKYFSFLPPLGDSRVIWAYGAGAAQALGPIAMSLGVFSRLGAVAMAGTMVGATYYSVITTGLEGFPLSKMASRVPIFHNYGFETPVLYFAMFAFVAAAGPGKLSLAQVLGWNDDKTLLGKIKQ